MYVYKIFSWLLLGIHQFLCWNWCGSSLKCSTEDLSLILNAVARWRGQESNRNLPCCRHAWFCLLLKYKILHNVAYWHAVRVLLYIEIFHWTMASNLFSSTPVLGSSFPCTFIQHCFICRPSDSTVLVDGRVEPRTACCKVCIGRQSC
jgi:hypothetical protein